MSTILSPPGPARGRPRLLDRADADRPVAARGRTSRGLAVPLAGLAGIAALVPVHDAWAAQLVLLGLLLTVPGLALLRALGIPAVALRATPVYVPAAALAVLLVAGLGVNVIGPEAGLERPLATLPLLAGVEALSLLLLAVAAVRRTEEAAAARPAPRVRARDLWPLVLPLVAAAGAARLTTGEGSAAAVGGVAACTLALAIGIAMAPRLGRTANALLVFGIGLALAWSFSLTSGFVYGFDISAEYQVVHGTGLAGVWELSHPDDAYGAMLSLTVLPAVLREIAGVSDLVLLKAVYPAVFALVPVTVFLVARRFLAPRFAMAAAAVVLVQSYFFQQIPAVARQEIAMVLFAVLLAAIADRTLGRGRGAALAAVLGLALVVSHYSTTYLAIAVLAVAVVLQLGASLVRRVPRLSGAVVVGLLAMVAGAALWYGPVTHSASNLGDFRENVRANGLQFLPNREAGESVVEAYLKGNQTSQIGAAEYEALSARDYAKNRPFVIPIPAAASPEYALRDAAVPAGPARTPAARDALDRAALVLQQALNLLAIVASLALALRRRTPARLRTLAIVGASTLGVLALMRLSGTAANAYNQERAYLQAMLPLAVGVAWALQLGVRSMRRLAPAGVAAVAAAAVVLLANSSGLADATLGGGGAGNVRASGEDHERFSATTPELAAARFAGTEKPADAILYTDRYGQLRVLSQVAGPPPLLDPTPRTLDQHAWVYGDRANVVSGRARSVNSGHFALYGFPSRFLADQFSTVYANGSSEVYRR